MVALIRLLLLLALVLGVGPAGWGLPPAWAQPQDGVQERGAQLFANHCAACHVNGGNIIRRGKTLKLAALQRQGIDGPAAIAAIAAGGVGQMGGYAAVLAEGGAEAVGAWVWQQALDDWPRA
ncbi:MAG: c-type cytochrome [Prochlorococcaceae cyanobacterium]